MVRVPSNVPEAAAAGQEIKRRMLEAGYRAAAGDFNTTATCC